MSFFFPRHWALASWVVDRCAKHSSVVYWPKAPRRRGTVQRRQFVSVSWGLVPFRVRSLDGRVGKCWWASPLRLGNTNHYQYISRYIYIYRYLPLISIWSYHTHIFLGSMFCSQKVPGSKKVLGRKVPHQDHRVQQRGMEEMFQLQEKSVKISWVF